MRSFPFDNGMLVVTECMKLFNLKEHLIVDMMNKMLESRY